MKKSMIDKICIHCSMKILNAIKIGYSHVPTSIFKIFEHFHKAGTEQFYNQDENSWPDI